ncbi:hypothetical protein AAFH68_28240 [Flavobacterium sp. CGRL1]
MLRQLKKNVKIQLVKPYNKSLAHKDYSLNFKKIFVYTVCFKNIQTRNFYLLGIKYSVNFREY